MRWSSNTSSSSSSSTTSFLRQCVARSTDIHGPENFPSGCQISPDGSCVLTYTVDDSQLRLYNTALPPFATANAATATTTTTTTTTPSTIITKEDEEEEEEDKSQESKHIPFGNKDDAADHANLHSSASTSESSCSISWKAALSISGGNTVRSYAWYPRMKSSDPVTCCFASAAKNQPIHLWDAYHGTLRASYSPMNALDELSSPTVIAFDPTGAQLLAAGFRNSSSSGSEAHVQIFDVNRPGRDSMGVLHLGSGGGEASSSSSSSSSFSCSQRRCRRSRSRDGPKGRISTLAFHHPSTDSAACATGDCVAVGTYGPGTIYVYDLRRATDPSGVIRSAASAATNAEPWVDSSYSLGGRCLVGHGRHHARKQRCRMMSHMRNRVTVTAAAAADNTSGEGDHDDTHENEDVMEWISSAKMEWFHSRTQRGVTQLQFSPTPQPYYLYSASRRSGVVLKWDLRMLGDVQVQADHDASSLSNRSSHTSCLVGGIASFATPNDTNQRLEFDLDGTERIFVGGMDGLVRIYSTTSGEWIGSIPTTSTATNATAANTNTPTTTTSNINTRTDAVANGVSVWRGEEGSSSSSHHHSPRPWVSVAIASGARYFPSDHDLDADCLAPEVHAPNPAGSLCLFLSQ